MENNESMSLIKSITSLYNRLLLRDPDRDGLIHWISEIDNGKITLLELEKFIRNSNEFKLSSDLKNGFTKIFDDIELFINPDDNILSRKLVYEKIWEPKTTNFMKKIIETGNIGIDVGAHIGYFTVLMAKLVGDSGKIFSYEPEPLNYNLLQQNIKQNLLNNVISKQSAIGDYSGTTKLYLSKDNTGDNRTFSTKMLDSDTNRMEIDVKINSLDKEIPDTKIDFIKIDVEGYEWNVINGGKRILEENKKIKLFIEFYPMALKANDVEPKKLLSYFLDKGFNIFSIDEHLRLINFSIDDFCKYHEYYSAVNLYCERS